MVRVRHPSKGGSSHRNRGRALSWPPCGGGGGAGSPGSRWTLVLLVLGLFYGNDRPAQAGALFVLGFAFIGSLLHTRRLKRKQRARREAREAAQRMQPAQATQPPQRGPSPPPTQATKQLPGR